MVRKVLSVAELTNIAKFSDEASNAIARSSARSVHARTVDARPEVFAFVDR